MKSTGIGRSGYEGIPWVTGTFLIQGVPVTVPPTERRFKRRYCLIMLARRPTGSWPLVGRAEELSLSASALVNPGAGGVVVTGPAGVGKTRLAREVVARADADGWVVAWAQASRSAAAVALGALAHLLPPLGKEPADRSEVLRRANRALRRRAEGGRLLVAVDDAHLLDDASATLVLQLARSGEVAVVVTLRSGVRAPDAVVALWKDDVATRVEVQALSSYEVAELIGRVLGGQVEESTVARMWQVTAGNVLFLRELVTLGRERGALAEREGLWCWRGPLATAGRLVELVEEHMGALDAELASLAEVLAYAEPVPLALAERLAEPNLLAMAEARGLVSVEETHSVLQVRLAHPLYGETLRARLAPLQTRAVATQLLEACGSGIQSVGPLRVAMWRLEAGRPGPPGALVDAARVALARSEPGLAGRLASAALEAGAGYKGRLALAKATMLEGRPEDAADMLAHAPEAPENDAEAAAGAVLWSAATFFGLGDAKAADTILDEVGAALTDGAARALLLAHRAALALNAGHPYQAEVAARAVLAMPGATSVARLRAVGILAPAVIEQGRVAEGLALADEHLGEALAASEEVPNAAGELLMARCYGLWISGDLPGMAALAEGLRARCVEEHRAAAAGVFGVFCGRAALSSGKVGSAARLLRDAAATLRQEDPASFLTWSLAALAQARAMAADTDGAAAALSEVESIAGPGAAIFADEVSLAKAWLSTAHAELSRARVEVLALVERLAASGQLTAELLAAHDAVRLGAARQVVERLGFVATMVEGPLGPVFAAHANATVAGDGAALDEVASRLEALGYRLMAAEAAAEAASCHRGVGRRGAALVSAGRARVLLQDCEGALTPALAALDDGDGLDTLTGREREVAALAVRGLTNAQVAERLALSARTVENHLHHVYAKLGVSGRANLARALPQALGKDEYPSTHDSPTAHP